MSLAFVQGIGPLELSIVLVIVLLIFGPKRLPAMARSVGSGMREFKDSLTGKSDDDDKDERDDASPAERPALAQSDDPAPAPAPASAEPVAAERPAGAPVGSERA